jgi:D-tyrosyl-tRNA(Tyr) deacylase
MRAVVQRVSAASVSVEGRIVGKVGLGLCVLIGVHRDDREDEGRSLAQKIAGLRVFEDDEGKMNRDVRDVGGDVLAISQFTLFGDVRRGRRPSFGEAREPVAAKQLFEAFCRELRGFELTVETGKFGAKMEVRIDNTGPVTILVDTARTF